MAEDSPRAIHVDWASASVDDASLTVGLTGTSPSEWHAFGRVIERLRRSGSGWGEIGVDGREITVADVTPGAEGDLRHVLESAVMQANASAALEEDEPARDDEDAGSSPDQAMTRTFRSFAERGRS